ncbi:hypothetical protein J2X45_003170 [Caulobacter sp. BE264]|uniref:hypothetical protein n=1 Tax=Caulobacter sp. BE264 TaxID=2817724 RepID=UPI002859AA27|nr:hypothetical protein [Caulobacter sp. BE264]MDR7232067.1 hypothetical protein [Caulobacter sp. BE264]
MIKLTAPHLRFAVAMTIIGALVLCIGTLVYWPMPDGNRELLATLTGALTLLARDATRWVFPQRGNDEEKS